MRRWAAAPACPRRPADPQRQLCAAGEASGGGGCGLFCGPGGGKRRRTGDKRQMPCGVLVDSPRILIFPPEPLAQGPGLAVEMHSPRKRAQPEGDFGAAGRAGRPALWAGALHRWLAGRATAAEQSAPALHGRAGPLHLIHAGALSVERARLAPPFHDRGPLPVVFPGGSAHDHPGPSGAAGLGARGLSAAGARVIRRHPAPRARRPSAAARPAARRPWPAQSRRDRHARRAGRPPSEQTRVFGARSPGHGARLTVTFRVRARPGACPEGCPGRGGTRRRDQPTDAAQQAGARPMSRRGS